MTDVSIRFDRDVPARRRVNEMGFPWGTISNSGEAVKDNGWLYFFDVARIFDPREPKGKRVTWEVELRRRWGNSIRVVTGEHKELRQAIIDTFKEQIERDNRRISDAQMVDPTEPEAVQNITSFDIPPAWVPEDRPAISEAEEAELVDRINGNAYLQPTEDRRHTVRMGLVGMQERLSSILTASDASEEAAWDLGRGIEVVRTAMMPGLVGKDREVVTLDSARLHRIATRSLGRLNPRQVLETLMGGRTVHTWHFSYSAVRSVAA